MLLFCSPICASLPAAKTLLPPLIQRARRKPPFSLLCPVLFFCPLFIGRRGRKGKEGKSVLPPPPSLSSSRGRLQGSISYYVGESLARDRLSPEHGRKSAKALLFLFLLLLLLIQGLVSAALPPSFSFSLRRPPSPSLRLFLHRQQRLFAFPSFFLARPENGRRRGGGAK